VTWILNACYDEKNAHHVLVMICFLYDASVTLNQHDLTFLISMGLNFLPFAASVTENQLSMTSYTLGLYFYFCSSLN
jgi:hypothetical protein